MSLISTLILYFIVSMIVCIVTTLSIKFNRKELRFISVILALIIPSIISGIRYNVGTDYGTYEQAFRAIAENNSIRKYVDFEIGYIWINKVISFLGGNFSFLTFIMTLLTMYFIYMSLINEKDNIFIGFSMFIYMFMYYLTSFNLIRQSLAISIGLYALTCLNAKKKYKFIFYTLLASLFHKSALILLGVFIIKYVFENRKAKFIQIIIFIILIVLVFNRELIGELVYIVYRNSYYSGYFTRYADTNASILGYWVKSLPIILCCLVCKKSISRNKGYNLYYNLMICGYIFGMLGCFTNTQVQRISYYFTYLSIFVLSFSYKNIELKYKKLFGLVIVIVVMFTWGYSYFYKNFGHVVPFITIFN